MIMLTPYQERVPDSLRVRDADGGRFFRHRKRGKTTLTTMRLAVIGTSKTLQANSHEAFRDSASDAGRS